MTRRFYLGQAGWSLASPLQAAFPTAGTHLQRYAEQLRAVEINSSFYKTHQLKTYSRWAASVPGDFRFAVKVPQSITHEARLVEADALWHEFLNECQTLGVKLGPLLLQLPPSLTFAEGVASKFFAAVRASFHGNMVLEARHPTWFQPPADDLLAAHRISRVIADPPLSADLDLWSSSADIVYARLHGSPKMYYSAYSDEQLASFAEPLAAAWHRGQETWCIFDNTAAGAALPDALRLARMLTDRGVPEPYLQPSLEKRPSRPAGQRSSLDRA